LGVYVTNNTDCDDTNATANPNGTEVCDNAIDEDCSGVADVCNPVDGDGDGELTPTDCDDTNAAINTSATEVCGNGIDENCDGTDDVCPGLDADGDGFSSPIDCNDNNASIYPGATEICFDNLDNNCNGGIDEGCVSNVDADGDGFVAGYDCDDANASVNPASAEFCNDIDDDCDGILDDSTGVAFYQDADGDLLGNINATFLFCSQPNNGWVSNTDDCDDSSASLLGPGSPCDNGSTADVTDTYQLDCTCQGLLIGCIDPNACNFNPEAMIQDPLVPCVMSNYTVGSIVGDTLVDTYSYQNYSYNGNLDSVSLVWTLNSPGIFIPISNVATTPAVNVYWSEGNNFDPQGEITLIITDTTNGCNAQFEITLNVTFDTTSTGIADEDESPSILVWPNPSNGQFGVVVPSDVKGQYSVAIYSMTGELVYKVDQQNNKVWNADLDLVNGMYIMKLVADNTQHVIQLVIER
jgi:hypothetical protein